MKVYFPLYDAVAQLQETVATCEDAVKFVAQLDSLKNRSILFFDEIVTGYVVLTNGDQDVLNEKYMKQVQNLTRIAVELSVQPSMYLKGAKERILLKLVGLTNSDLVYNGFSSTVGVSIWRFEISISYPKRKIDQPKIIFNVRLQLPREVLTPKVAAQVDLSKSRNLLQGVVSKTFENTHDPFLPESLLEPAAPSDAPLAPVLMGAKYSLPVYPILTMRLKSAKLAGLSNTVLLTLQLSPSRDVFKIEKLSVVVSKVELTLKDGDVVPLFDSDYFQTLKFNDENDTVNLTFRLHLHSNSDISRPLNIKIFTIPQIDNVKLTDQIEMKWITNVNFEVTKKKLLSQQQLRKSELKLSNQSYTTAMSGLKFTIFGTNKVQLGDVFQWHIQLINNTLKSTKLMILLNRDSFLTDSVWEKKMPPLPVTPKTKSRSTVSLNSIPRDQTSVIHPQLNLIRNYNLNKQRTSGIVVLDNEILIDNLESHGLTEFSFKIMAIQKGIFSLDGVKLIDLNSGDTYECRKLLQVIVD